MSDFVNALELNDTTLRVDSETDDRELHEMADSMNRIISIHNASKRDLETRKLYYDRILRVMTHEMRNSITPIVALSEDMIQNPGNYDKSAVHEAVEVINGESRNISKFLDSYYTLTHLPHPEREEISAMDFFKRVKKATDVFADKFGVPIENVEYLIPSELTMDIDPGMMSQAVVNLIKNSMEAVSGKGNEGSVKIVVTQNLYRTLIMIEDNGPGLAEKIKMNLFQPFLTTKEHGSGIGMFITRQIVRLHGGDIRISSQQGKGVSIQIELIRTERQKDRKTALIS